ncbi:MAG: hypothetical protein O3A18_04680 [Planctomycetota bacterium]|jgi:hypothetical protein|nr:hypothetical protein [Planctomycetota bacterium]
MSDLNLGSRIPPDALFVIACPVCQGEVAAAGRIAGTDACCPLCASLFRVPHPPSELGEDAADQPPLPAAGLAEDWDDVIIKLAPPETVASEEPVVEEPVVEEPVVEEPFPQETPPEAIAAEDSEELSPEPVLSNPMSTEALPDERAVISEPAAAVVSVTPPEELSFLDQPPLDPAAGDLVFQEPVRTVRHGGEVIEIRRLSPEERRKRRFRRTLMMIVIGGSILLLIVILNLPQK